MCRTQIRQPRVARRLSSSSISGVRHPWRQRQPMLCSSRHTVETATVRRPRHSRAGLLKPYHHRAALSTRFLRKRHEADAVAAPCRMRERRALVAARRAARALTQLVARCIRAPKNDRCRKGHRRIMRTALAIYPPPRTRALQLAKRRPRPRRRLVSLSGRPVGVVLQGASFAAHVGESHRGRRGGSQPLGGRSGISAPTHRPYSLSLVAERP
jgi:hypothetical protein